jgi:aspartate carbamoyltransferase catalytic subunit
VSEKSPLQHVLESQQLSRSFLDHELFPAAYRMQMSTEVVGDEISRSLAGQSISCLFYEPSTRTRFSFEQAAGFLGARVVSSENAGEFSSAIKGESIEDTVRVMEALKFSAVIMRTKQAGDAKKAAAVSKIPIINAGDGAGQHPTQALLDLYTIHQKFGLVDDLRVALVGDLANGRTARSLAYLLGKYENIYLDLVAPVGMQMKQDILDYLGSHGIRFEQHQRLVDVAEHADAIYMTRAQTERMPSEDTVNGEGVRINDYVMAAVKKHAIIMHPLPRSDDFAELPEKYTDDPRVVIFQQVANGLYTRMALLNYLLN